jgi:hypothetical protein
MPQPGPMTYWRSTRLRDIARCKLIRAAVQETAEQSRSIEKRLNEAGVI